LILLLLLSEFVFYFCCMHPRIHQLGKLVLIIKLYIVDTQL
jgi:hypothetical protein